MFKYFVSKVGSLKVSTLFLFLGFVIKRHSMVGRKEKKEGSTT